MDMVLEFVELETMLYNVKIPEIVQEKRNFMTKLLTYIYCF